VLVVTPVLFFLIRERRLGLQEQPLADSPSASARPLIVTGVVMAVIAAGAWGAWQWSRTRGAPSAGPPAATIVHQLQSGNLQIALVSTDGALHTGRNSFAFEFRRGGQPVDVGRVRATGNMPMPGMVMSSGMEVRATGMTGRYAASAEFGMAGAWQMSIEWDGPAGRGSASFEGAVQ
jgi:hypothetical protein